MLTLETAIAKSNWSRAAHLAMAMSQTPTEAMNILMKQCQAKATQYNVTTNELLEPYSGQIQNGILYCLELKAFAAPIVKKTGVHLYGSFTRPLGGWARDILEHGAFVHCESPIGHQAHSYVIAEHKLPETICERFELTPIHHPPEVMPPATIPGPTMWYGDWGDVYIYVLEGKNLKSGYLEDLEENELKKFEARKRSKNPGLMTRHFDVCRLVREEQLPDDWTVTDLMRRLRTAPDLLERYECMAQPTV